MDRRHPRHFGNSHDIKLRVSTCDAIYVAYAEFRTTSSEAHMTSPLLPTTVSKRMGAALTGRSPKAFREIAGFFEPVKVDGRMPLTVIEHIRGAEVTVEDYLAACRSLEARRQRERGYKTAQRRSLELEISGDGQAV